MAGPYLGGRESWLYCLQTCLSPPVLLCRAVGELPDNKPRDTEHSLKIPASWSPLEVGLGEMQCPRWLHAAYLLRECSESSFCFAVVDQGYAHPCFIYSSLCYIVYKDPLGIWFYQQILSGWTFSDPWYLDIMQYDETTRQVLPTIDSSELDYAKDTPGRTSGDHNVHFLVNR